MVYAKNVLLCTTLQTIKKFTIIVIYIDPDDYDTWYHQYDDIIDQIKDWVSAQENLDVYQMNSFYAGISNKRRQCVNYYKTAMVFFIQTAGAGYLAYNEFFLNQDASGAVCKYFYISFVI